MKTNSVTPLDGPHTKLARSSTTSAESPDPAPQSFTDTFDELFGKTKGSASVDEEQLYGAGVGQALLKEKGRDAYSEFSLAFKINMSEPVPGRAGSSAEYSTNQALRDLRKGGLLTRDEVLSIRRKSFEAAQLDSNSRKLWDRSGGSGKDGTVATSSFTKAAQLVSERLNLNTAAVDDGTKVGARNTKQSDLETAPLTFSKTFTDLIGSTAAKAKVNEEQLYSATVSHELLARKGLDAQTEFSLAFRINMSEPVPGRSGTSAEYSTNQALRELRKGGFVTRDEVLEIRRKSFESAQLDEKITKLWDSSGGSSGDGTIATQRFSTAASLISERLGLTPPEDDSTTDPVEPPDVDPTTDPVEPPEDDDPTVVVGKA